MYHNFKFLKEKKIKICKTTINIQALSPALPGGSFSATQHAAPQHGQRLAALCCDAARPRAMVQQAGDNVPRDLCPFGHLGHAESGDRSDLSSFGHLGHDKSDDRSDLKREAWAV